MTTEPLTFDAIPAGTVFAVDTEKRVIRGMAVPYNVEATKNGQRFMFSRGTIDTADPGSVKLWVNHDKSTACGVAFELDDREDGLYAAFKVARGAEGDKALSMAEDGVWDRFSIGPREGTKFSLRDGIQHAVRVVLGEISLTPVPVFTGARVQSVSFDANTEGKNMPEETQTVETVTAPVDFSALTDAISQGFANMQFPQRETVAAGGATFEVNEPSPYRFDGTEGAESFSADLRSYKNGDPDAQKRIHTFMEDAFETFAVTTSNTTTLNPTQNRPDLFVPNLTFTRPLYNLVTTGGLVDRTPFTIPKFASASGLVGAHTEGVEPTPGAFTATSQTITPGAISGKVEITREVWDQGGSPQADQIIWGELLNGYFEAIEAKIATTLAAVGTAEINLASAVNSALVDAVTNVFVDLQFVRGGNRFSALALDGMLFKALVNAADTSGRKLLPVVNPSNAQGSTNGGFSQVQIGSQIGSAAWALGATNASKSYLFVPSSVYAWASAPKRFDFDYRVSAVDLAVFGYTASAVTRDSDVRPLDYTTADA